MMTPLEKEIWNYLAGTATWMVEVDERPATIDVRVYVADGQGAHHFWFVSDESAEEMASVIRETLCEDV